MNDLTNFYEDENEVKEELKKTSDIRKAVVPIFETMFEKMLNEIKPKEQHIHLPDKVVGEHSISVDIATEKIEKVLNETFEQFKKKLDEVVVVKDEIKKVEITNPPSKPIINVVEKNIEFPKVQVVEDKVTVKKMDRLEKAINNLTEILITKESKFPYDKDERIPVKVMEMPMAQGTASNVEEKIWLKEEYTYTTISGSRVPTTIKKWDDSKLVTETYTYEAITIDSEITVSPISKTRTVEPY